MSKLNLWRMAAVVCLGLFLFSLALFGVLKQGYNQVYDMAVRQQTEIIDKQAAIIRQLLGDNRTAPKYFPPGAPV